jgi:cytochrome P450
MFKTMAIEQLVVKALGEAVSRIAKKVSEGKRLSDREVVVLVMSLMMGGSRTSKPTSMGGSTPSRRGWTA